MSDVPAFLPWQLPVARAWLASKERFSHAWLVHGLAGTGKRRFALAGAASLLCEAPQGGLACGHCAACLWVAAGNHPDLRRIRPDAVALEEGGEAEEESATASKAAPSRDIRVDQLRALSSWFNTATHRGGWRVAVLYPAQALNAISANALLKVLEEPPEHTIFLLVADAPDRLLPTLVSRCRRLPLAVPGRDEALAWLAAQGVEQPEPWLAAAGGAPLAALDLSRSRATACPEWLERLLAALAQGRAPDIGELADELEKEAPAAWLDALQRLFLDLLLAASSAPLRYFPQAERNIRRAAGHASLASLGETGKWLGQQRALAGHPLNGKLFAHAVLQRVAQACAQGA